MSTRSIDDFRSLSRFLDVSQRVHRAVQTSNGSSRVELSRLEGLGSWVVAVQGSGRFGGRRTHTPCQPASSPTPGTGPSLRLVVPDVLPVCSTPAQIFELAAGRAWRAFDLVPRAIATATSQRLFARPPRKQTISPRQRGQRCSFLQLCLFQCRTLCPQIVFDCDHLSGTLFY